MTKNNTETGLTTVSQQEILADHESKQLAQLQRKFMQSYLEHKDHMEVGAWLNMALAEQLPEQDSVAIATMSNDIINTIQTNQAHQESLEAALADGRSKESWLASTLKKALSHRSTQNAAQYLLGLDDALDQANKSMQNILTTKQGTISQNPNLDGFIAEQQHVNSFNLQAKLNNSEYRAEVLLPKDGQTYGKNSVDIVIKDGNGKVVRRYQSKYGADAASTQKGFNNGDYRGQRKLVPEGQSGEISKASDVLVAPDGTTSTPLSKQRAKEIQQEAQSGNWQEANWNEYKTKDLAKGIGYKAGYAALQGAAMGAGIEIASKMIQGEELDGEAIVESALKTGADFGVKAAAAGALKVGVEKGIVKAIPKGTPAGVIANIAYVGIENIKVMCEVASGELSVQEGMDKIEVVTVSTVAGIAASAKGAAIGATIGTVFGPVGSVIGGFIGGTVGYIAGSKVGELAVKGAQKVRKAAKKAVTYIADKISDGVSNAFSSIGNFASSLFSW